MTALAALLLVAPIVLAYRWLPPRTRRVVPALVLLRRLEPGAVVTRHARQIEDLLLLLLLCSALVALVLGLAAARDDRPAILVLDRSPSMASDAGGETRFEHAQAGMRDWLVAHPDAPAGLLVTSEPALAISPTLDHRAVLRAIGESTVAVDREWSVRCPDMRVVLASDGPFQAPESCDTTRLDLGPNEPNGGFVAVAVRPTDALGGIEIAAETAGEDGQVALVGDDGTLGGWRGSETIARYDVPGGAFRLSIPPGDALAADDTVRVGRTALVRVVLVTTQPTGFTARALAAHPGVALQVAGPDQPLPADVDVLVIEDSPAGTLPTARATVWLGTAEGSGFAVSGRAEHPDVRPSPSPWMRYVEPSTIRVASSLVFAAGPTVVLDSSRGPLAVAREADGRTALALGFGPRTSDLGLDVAFLHLLANVVDAARPSTAVVEGVLSRTETLASAPAPTAQASHPVAWRWGTIVALGCLLLEGVLTHLVRRRR